MEHQKNEKVLEEDNFKVPDETISMNISGINFEFDLFKKDTRSGFSNTAILYADGNTVCKVKTNYLNRAYERYDYQSIMVKAIDSAIEQFSKKSDSDMCDSLTELKKTH